MKRPSELEFSSCCNNFWWCIQNVAKGLVRGELAYAMTMYHTVVREELHWLLNWYISAGADFRSFIKAICLRDTTYNMKRPSPAPALKKGGKPWRKCAGFLPAWHPRRRKGWDTSTGRMRRRGCFDICAG